MAGQIDARLADLGIELAAPPAPAANYVPYVIAGDMVFVSGQIPMTAAGIDTLIKGKVGADIDVEGATVAARQCAINLLAQVKVACGGDLDRLVRVVKLTGFVNSVPEFGEQPKVVNGASDLLVEVLGDKGRHSRSAVSAGSLPFGCAVEVEGIFQITPN